ncbi:hypothetical protein CRENPOLYSF2_1150014 [Crenothrix polyspora]|uniref:Uncharacterized protein n=1 Tax=Crenothrix polyspora TaxID=360316 RepID=A0A1R4GZK5_9GAMM|nr:hypothetical protein CRENPOLYSF2_1150014 [Crenothrix polyspora]
MLGYAIKLLTQPYIYELPITFFVFFVFFVDKNRNITVFFIP